MINNFPIMNTSITLNIVIKLLGYIHLAYINGIAKLIMQSYL